MYCLRLKHKKETNLEEEKQKENTYKPAYDKESLLQVKANLGVVRLALEEKLKKTELQALEFQKNLTQLVHKERLLRLLNRKEK